MPGLVPGIHVLAG